MIHLQTIQTKINETISTLWTTEYEHIHCQMQTKSIGIRSYKINWW